MQYLVKMRLHSLIYNSIRKFCGYNPKILRFICLTPHIFTRHKSSRLSHITACLIHPLQIQPSRASSPILMLNLPSYNLTTNKIIPTTCTTSIAGTVYLKYHFRVLCLNTCIAINAPSEPPINAVIRRVASLMRHLLCIAFHLSIPYKANVTTLIINKYIPIILSITSL